MCLQVQGYLVLADTLAVFSVFCRGFFRSYCCENPWVWILSAFFSKHRFRVQADQGIGRNHPLTFGQQHQWVDVKFDEDMGRIAHHGPGLQ